MPRLKITLGQVRDKSEINKMKRKTQQQNKETHFLLYMDTIGNGVSAFGTRHTKTYIRAADQANFFFQILLNKSQIFKKKNHTK